MRTWHCECTRRLATVGLLSVVAGCLLLGGCRQETPLSEVEQFMARYRGLETPAYIDTLRTMLDDDPPAGLYARFELGNVFYAQASDTAVAVGWQNPVVAAALDSAQVYFEAAVQQDTTFVPALVNLGSLWDDRAQNASIGRANRTERQEYLAVAESLYQQAVRHAPDDETARCNLGALYLDMRRPTDAVAQFQHVLDVNPKSALAHYNLAIMFAEEKIYREAIAELQAAVKYDPDGDIGERSRDNIKILNDMMNAPLPENLGGAAAH